MAHMAEQQCYGYKDYMTEEENLTGHDEETATIDLSSHEMEVRFFIHDLVSSVI